MSQDNRSGRPQGRPPEGDARLSRVEASLRGPFLLFFVSAVAWLLAASLLALVASLGLGSSAGLFRDCEFLTYGRVVAAERNLFVYGWGFNAFFAVNLWLLSQLGRFEFRNGWLATLGGAVWNLALDLRRRPDLRRRAQRLRPAGDSRAKSARSSPWPSCSPRSGPSSPSPVVPRVTRSPPSGSWSAPRSSSRWSISSPS